MGYANISSSHPALPHVLCLNILSLQLLFPDLVEGLVLINIDPSGKGWIDWATGKVSTVLNTINDHIKNTSSWNQKIHSGCEVTHLFLINLKVGKDSRLFDLDYREFWVTFCPLLLAHRANQHFARYHPATSLQPGVLYNHRHVAIRTSNALRKFVYILLLLS